MSNFIRTEHSTKVHKVQILDKLKHKDKQACYYERANRRDNPQTKTRAEIYEAIKTNYVEETESILSGFKKGIVTKFNSEDKKPYQDAKLAKFPIAIFSGFPEQNVHNGIINLDIDENRPEELNAFLERIKAGEVNIVEAAFLSVSGKLTGAFSANIRIEIPAKSSLMSSRLKKMAGITGSAWSDFVKPLHTAYYRALSYILKKQAGINTGVAKDVERARYLSHDPDIYVNWDAEVYSLRALEEALSQIEREESRRKKEIGGFEKLTVNIETSNAFDFAVKFAENKGYAFTGGQRHNFRTFCSIALNLLGIDQDAAREWLLQDYAPENGDLGNCLSYPYKKYEESHGIWGHKLLPDDALAEYELILKKGLKLSNISPQFEKIITLESEKRDQVLLSLESGTGTGKTYAAVHCYAPFLFKLNEYKTVIVVSLNSKGEKDSKQYNIPFVSGENIKKAPNKKEFWAVVLGSPVILCNQHLFPKLAQMFEQRRERLNVFIDESQTIVEGTYKQDVPSNLMRSAMHIGETVTLMSGTPKPYFREIGFKRVKVTQEERPGIRLIVRRREKNKALTAYKHCAETDLSKKRLVVKIQSKKSIEALRLLLTQRGVLKAAEIVTLYSEKSVKESPQYKRFTNAGREDGSFADQVKIILCTSFINEGLDIYSAYDLEFVTIEQRGTFSVSELVQFADRWRTDRQKTMVGYFHFRAEDQDPGPFNEMQVFKDQLSLSEDMAAAFNMHSDRAKEFYSPKHQFGLGSEHSHLSKFLHLDPDNLLCKPDTVAIMGEVERLKTAHTTTQRGLKEIAEKYPYFEIIDQQNYCLHEDFSLEADAQEANAKYETEKNRARDQMISLYESKKEVLFQSICERTENADLKQKIDCQESRKEAVAKMVDKHPQIFREYFSEAERLIKSHFKLEALKLEPEEIRRNLLPRGDLISAQKLSIFVNGLRLHVALYFAKYTISEYKFSRRAVQVLTATQWADIEKISEAAEAVKVEAEKNNGRLTPLEIFKTVSKVYRYRKIRPYNTQNKAVKMVNTVFETERLTGDEAVYLVKGRRTLLMFICAHGIDPEKYLEKIHNYLETNISATKISRQTLQI